MPPRKRLGQLLTELGVIDEHQLQSALGHQKQWGGKLGGILVQKGFCSEDAVVSALAKHLGMQRVKIAEVKIDPRALKCVSKQIAEKLHVVPYEISGSGRSEVVTVAMSDPTDLSAVDQLAFHTGKRIKPLLAGDGEIIAAIQAHYGASEDKKEPTDKVARPAPAGPPTVTPGAPAGSVAGFPRRIEPSAGPGAPAAGAAARPAPYIPPPIPAAKPPGAAQKLEEIDPGAGLGLRGRAAPAEPVDLPEIDEGDFGLEPIAAHSQFGDAVAGQEEVTGDGTAADAVEGLVSASVAHAGAAEARKSPGRAEATGSPGGHGGWGDPADPAPGPTGWTGPIQSVASGAPAPTGWTGPIESASSAETGWTGPIDVKAAGGWGEPGAQAPAPAGWPAPAAGSWGASAEPASDAAWGVPEADQAREAASGALALPTDAILGALQETASDVTAAEMQWGDDTSSVPAAPSGAADREAANDAPAVPDAQPHEAEAPDAWASSDDPLAAEGAPADPLGGEPGLDDPLAADVSANTPSWQEPANEAAPLLQHGNSTTQEFANPATESGLEGAEGQTQESPDWRQEQGAEGSPPSPQPVDYGQTGDAFTPLSEADLGTLASIGVEPSDGMGALRLLAALVRILNRGQHIEPHELRAEIHESLAQGAMAAASAPPGGMEPDVSSSGDDSIPTETAET